MKLIGVSKFRLMCGRSRWCAVCGAALKPPAPSVFVEPGERHLCPKHRQEYRLVVVDSQTYPVNRHLGEVWSEDDAKGPRHV